MCFESKRVHEAHKHVTEIGAEGLPGIWALTYSSRIFWEFECGWYRIHLPGPEENLTQIMIGRGLMALHEKKPPALRWRLGD